MNVDERLNQSNRDGDFLICVGKNHQQAGEKTMSIAVYKNTIIPNVLVEHWAAAKIVGL